MKTDFDIAIVGSGFAGSLMAMIARRLGRSVVLIERGKHPRFAIGESSTPLANLLLEEIATRYDLPRLLPLIKWGTWQQTYPQIGCGLKRGFTFYHHQLGQSFKDDATRSNQLLVAASPSDKIADTHWYRQDFDHFLVREAQELGVEYFDQVAFDSLISDENAVQINGTRQGITIALRAKFLIDATGPRGCVHRAFALPEIAVEHLPRTRALFTHFAGVRRLDELPSMTGDENPPYPPDDAAVHHVFDGGWIWVLRFNNGTVSAGVAATDRLAQGLRLFEGEVAWQRLLKLLPTVHEQFQSATAQFPFIHMPQLSFRSGQVTGANWAMLPSAAGFIDPLLSTGFPLTLLGISRLARLLECHWETARFAERLNDYSTQTAEDMRVAGQLVAALYHSMNDFAVFSSLSLLYFAAVSFSETARRLGKAELAPAFLLREHPVFAKQVHAACTLIFRAAGQGGLMEGEKAELHRLVADAIQPINVTGLNNPQRRNWYPASAQDLLDAAPKFGVSLDEMQQLLSRCGF